MAHSSMAVEATMEADLGEENSRAVSPNTHPGFLWILILPPSTCMMHVQPGQQSGVMRFDCTTGRKNKGEEGLYKQWPANKADGMCHTVEQQCCAWVSRVG